MNATRPAAPVLSSGAHRYIAACLALACAAAAATLAAPAADGRELAAFLALGLGAAFAELRVIEIRANHGFPTSIAFLVTGALLLPPALVALLAATQFLPEVLLRRKPWHIQAFNVSNGTLSALSAWLVARAATGGLGEGLGGLVIAGLGAAIVFVCLNHLLLAGALRLARGHSLARSGLFSTESLSIDLGLALVGVAAAGLADWNLFLVPLVLAPLLLAHRLLGGLVRLHLPEPEAPLTQPAG